MRFKINKSAPLRKLMDEYGQWLRLPASQTSRVCFRVGGERIDLDDTAEKLGLDGEDAIDVAIEPEGPRRTRA